MEIYGTIEASMKVPAPVTTGISKLLKARPGAEGVIIEIPRIELQRMKQMFEYSIKQRKLIVEDKVSYEKAEMMDMIGHALLNASQGNCKWFKDCAKDIYQDAEEFDKNSTKALLIGKTGIYILIAYNGKHVNGEVKKDDILRDEDPNLSLD